jgi:anaphase-promoting complex subunit 1
MHVLIKWYGMRNAPGTQDISPAQEWQLFIGVLLGKMSFILKEGSTKLCQSV